MSELKTYLLQEHPEYQRDVRGLKLRSRQVRFLGALGVDYLQWLWLHRCSLKWRLRRWVVGRLWCRRAGHRWEADPIFGTGRCRYCGDHYRDPRATSS